MSAESRESLHLRVMRLTNPSTEINPHPYLLLALDESFATFTEQDPMATQHVSSSKGGISTPTDGGALGHAVPPAEVYGLPQNSREALESGHALLLPTSQGRVFIGETFNAYVNLGNLGSAPVYRVSMQVELQLSAHNRFLLFDNSKSAKQVLSPSDALDCNVLHQLSEGGVYTLVCSVTYQTSPGSPQRVLRRLYKFSVGSPFKIAHKIAHVNERTFIHMTMENLTGGGVFLSDAKIRCPEGIESSRIDSAEHSQTNRGYRGLHFFKAREVYSLLFGLSTINSERGSQLSDPGYLKRLSNLGTLYIEWRTPLGGYGVVSDYRIAGSMRNGRPVELHVTSCPSSVQVEQPFKIEVLVVNHLDRPVEPLLVFDREKMSPLFTQGIATQTIGNVLPRQSKRFPLPLVAIKSGLHTLQGISLYDPMVQQVHEFGQLCEVIAL